MTHVLLATDADSLAEELFSALLDGDTTVSRVRAGADVRLAVGELKPDLVILDMQIGNMGGLATSLDLRHESGAGRLPHTRILMLLDREADRWIAGEAKADVELLKPLNVVKLRMTVAALLAQELEGVDA